jgi:hypothetical protein
MEKLKWAVHPLILEINTWIWLRELSDQYGKKITLENVPVNDLEEETRYFDAVWFMGVWTRSPKGREVALTHPDLQNEYKNSLYDFSEEDVVGSPYSIYDYSVDPHLGGTEGLKAVRNKLGKLGKMLILDFVPNHIAVDHPWGKEIPDAFVRGSEQDLASNPEGFFKRGDSIFAHGKDPYFPSWTDTLQANSFSRVYREKVIEMLQIIGEYCDGVRCDMAMLLVDRIFQQTWEERGGQPLEKEFWRAVIGSVKEVHPGFKFFAEVYWDMEWELQQQGFDFCYDKRLYDRLLHEGAGSIKGHLDAEWDYQKRLVRFVENHDEPRAVSAFGEKRSLAAASIVLSLPGARLLHFGQHLGRYIKLPVQLGRGEIERIVPAVAEHYRKLLPVISANIHDNGKWRLFHIDGDEFRQSPFISFLWESEKGMLLIVVNYSNNNQTGAINFSGLVKEGEKITEEMQQETILPDQNRIYINLSPWEVKVFRNDK